MNSIAEVPLLTIIEPQSAIVSVIEGGAAFDAAEVPVVAIVESAPSPEVVVVEVPSIAVIEAGAGSSALLPHAPTHLPGNSDPIDITSDTSAGLAPQSNLTAVVPPTVNDDSAAGYQVGSLWIDTVTGDIFHNVDATVGVAVWIEADVRIISTSIADFTIGQKFFLTRRDETSPVSKIVVVLQGSAGQSVTWELRKGSDLSVAGTVIHTAATTSITAGDTITTITTPAIVAGDHVWFEFTATAGTLVAFNAVVTF